MTENTKNILSVEDELIARGLAEELKKIVDEEKLKIYEDIHDGLDRLEAAHGEAVKWSRFRGMAEGGLITIGLVGSAVFVLAKLNSR